MHEQGVRLGAGHHFAVDAPVGKGFLACRVFGFPAHAGPDVGGDQVGAGAGFVRGLEELDVIAQFHARDRAVDVVAAGRADVHGKAEQLGRLQPGVGHVVAVTDPGHGLALDGAAVLDVGEDVGHDLARMVFVGQAVDHRHARELGKALDALLLEGADHHQVDHAADDACCVLDRFGAAELAALGGQVDHCAAQLVHAGLEADAGTRAGFLENHGQGAVSQGLVLLVALELDLDLCRTAEQVGVFVGTQVGELQVMADGHAKGFRLTNRGGRRAGLRRPGIRAPWAPGWR